MQSLLSTDSRPVPAPLLDHEAPPQGLADVPKARYTSPGWAALEAAHLWTRTWQMACHVDHLRQPGDHVVYDVAGQSVIVTRTRDGSIRAHHNACLHRGTRLRTDDGRVASFRCPFHGWRWDLDGRLVEIPSGWDFPTVGGERSCLPGARVAEWCGFVFVNLDPCAPPFEEYAAKLVEHFDGHFGLEDRYIAFHAVKEVAANWKICMEAFGEGYHSVATHPQILEFAADENSQYSIWPSSPFVTRFHNAFGSPSPHLGDVDEQRVADAYLAFAARVPAGAVPVPPGASARHVVAEVFRQAMGERLGCDLSTRSDAEVLDAILYHLFPAFAPWAGVGQSLVYRWRPGATPDTCSMDVIRMAPVPAGGERPDPAPVQRLSLEQSWHEAEGMGTLADVFEQDMANLPRVQAGMYSTGKPTVTFASYQEARMRMHHRMIDRFVLDGLGGDPPADLADLFVPDG